MTEEARQHVGREARKLERQVGHQQVGRRRHEEHREPAREEQREVLALVRLPAHLARAERHPDRGEQRQAEQHLEVDAEAVEHEHAAEEPLARRHPQQADRRADGRGRTRERDDPRPAAPLDAPGGEPEVERQHRHDGRREHQLGAEVAKALRRVHPASARRSSRAAAARRPAAPARSGGAAPGSAGSGWASGRCRGTARSPPAARA